MERLVFVHGSVLGARGTWGAQRALADRFELVVRGTPGFPPKPPVERVDFELDAELVAACSSRAITSSGTRTAVSISLLAAAARPELVRSLTVIEPPATRVAAGRPAVDAFAAGGAEMYASGASGAGDIPPTLPRGGRLGFRSALPADPGARAGRAGARWSSAAPGRRRSRSRRSPRPRSRSSSCPATITPRSTGSATSSERASAERLVLRGLRPHRPAASGVQRPPRRLRRRARAVPRRSSAPARSSCSRSRRRTRGFMSFTISSR